MKEQTRQRSQQWDEGAFWLPPELAALLNQSEPSVAWMSEQKGLFCLVLFWFPSPASKINKETNLEVTDLPPLYLFLQEFIGRDGKQTSYQHSTCGLQRSNMNKVKTQHINTKMSKAPLWFKRRFSVLTTRWLPSPRVPTWAVLSLFRCPQRKTTECQSAEC